MILPAAGAAEEEPDADDGTPASPAPVADPATPEERAARLEALTSTDVPKRVEAVVRLQACLADERGADARGGHGSVGLPPISRRVYRGAEACFTSARSSRLTRSGSSSMGMWPLFSAQTRRAPGIALAMASDSAAGTILS